MDQNTIFYPGDFILDSLDIICHTNVRKSLKLVYVEMNIYEDIFAQSVFGTIVINDGLNIIKQFPIVGGETVEISFQTPTLEKITKSFIVTQITNRKKINDREQTFVLNLVSPHFINSFKHRICQSFISQSVSRMCESILTEISAPIKKIEGTTGEYTFNIPNWHPFKCINWLTDFAISDVFPQAANYLFFETLDGYVFSSLESLITSTNNEATKDYIHQTANLRNPDGERNFADDFRNIESYSISSGFDLLKNYQRGMNGSTLRVVDLINQDFIDNKFSYFDTWTQHEHLESDVPSYLTRNVNPSGVLGQGISIPFIKDTDVFILPENNFYKCVFEHPRTFDGIDSFQFDKTLQIKISTQQQINNYKLQVIVPGDSSLKLASVVNVTLPSQEPLTEERPNDKIDTYLSGRYLVASIRHAFIENKYKQHLELIKDSFATALPAKGQNTLKVLEV